MRVWHAAGNATKEHEDLGFVSADGRVRLGFHWLPRFADHTPFQQPPLGRVDDRTGRLAFNNTLTDLLHALRAEAAHPDSVVVMGTQIFDILKAPLADYASNLALLVDHVVAQVPPPTPPTCFMCLPVSCPCVSSLAPAALCLDELATWPPCLLASLPPCVRVSTACCLHTPHHQLTPLLQQPPSHVLLTPSNRAAGARQRDLAYWGCAA